MKKQMMFLLLSVSVVLPLLATSAGAQCDVNTLKVQVPFDFTIRNRQFAAGGYTFQNECGVVTLRNPQWRVLGVFIAQRGDTGRPQSASKLVFLHQDGVNLLSSIAWEREAAVSVLASAHRETQTAARVFHSTAASVGAGGRP